MKSLMSLWSRLAEELARQCCTSAYRDINTVSVRVEHEGLSFLTITLPDYGKAIQKWLDLGQVTIHSSFRKERGGELPLFLGGFLSRVFDRNSGVLLDDPCVDSIRALRQLTLMFGKIELACSPARLRRAVANYVECEQEVREFDSALSERDLAEFADMSNLLYGRLFTRMDRDVYYGRVIPKHGPGSTADRLRGNAKYRLRSWTTRLEQAGLQAGENLLPNMRYYPLLDEVDFLEPGSEIPVKVTLVPKTLKTPRVIAMEPTCMQYMQQGVLRSFLEHFNRDDFLVKVIGFDDQGPNQDLARQGSLDQRTATLDLSDASDRVSNQLVRAMLRRWPHLHKAVDATRSRRAVLPGGGVIRLAKYASMGSALCFPIEAMVFTTLIFVGIQRSLNTSLSRRDLSTRFSGSVRVYGDDLIVPVDHVTSVVRTLEHFGAKVGTSKSFWTGKFRESCGREFFNGHDVSITRVRQVFPTQRQDVTEVVSLVSLRNQLYMSGYWDTCRWLDDYITGLLKYFPVVLPTASVLGRVSFLGYQTDRMHPSLHSPLVRGYVVKAKPPRDPLEGAAALLKCLLKLDSDAYLRDQNPWHQPDNQPFSGLKPERGGNWFTPEASSEHLERSGRPKSFSMKLGERSPF
ncbi:TPA_asm: RNA-directed RNA polymerase [ssRNA phage Zoerhiza.2_20]|uniref:RNA-directed RNA polymerase n=2 Tax=Leviviricetes TaxID=2842243 RepID=A0A8S5L1Z7_9VIRU|nr:RNA-directed RNA polymerase [ssRNA phage Zoerhiza.2_20]QDH89236.1 MAG: RNA-dependent RNA polymerase [Leviviridae sp.]DAD51389.1 TPA_asm: RNA-directed RNA polymerase [ssRNA phage Zoerhiza.2_20]